MKKTIPCLILITLIAVSILLLVYAILSTSIMSSILIAAAIVAWVALFGAIFSLYIGYRSRKRLKH